MKIRVIVKNTHMTDLAFDSGELDTVDDLGFKPGAWEKMSVKQKHYFSKKYVRDNGLKVSFEEYIN